MNMPFDQYMFSILFIMIYSTILIYALLHSYFKIFVGLLVELFLTVLLIDSFRCKKNN